MKALILSNQYGNQGQVIDLTNTRHETWTDDDGNDYYISEFCDAAYAVEYLETFKHNLEREKRNIRVIETYLED